MIVKMTGLQRRALLTYADEQIRSALEDGSTQTAYTRWHIEMPAIAWRRCLDDLRPRLYGPRGGFREASRSLRFAVIHAQNELTRLEHHPALTRASVMGWQVEAIPVWKIPGIYNLPPVGMTTHTYSIYPRRNPTGEFLILVDHHQTIRGHDITTWAPGIPDPSCRTHQESEHLIFRVG